MLTVLCILERGESLDVIKRVEPQSPLWPMHARQLEESGLLDVIDASPLRYEPKQPQRIGQSEKVLRVPRVVRDYVVAIISPDERARLIRAAATVYFGSDWRNGSLRARRRSAFSHPISTHRFGNEMLLLRMLLSERQRYPELEARVALVVALKYIGNLQEQGFYGESYDAAREILSLIETDPELTGHEVELAEIQLTAGKCARMIGERAAAIDLLSAVLPAARRLGNRDRLGEVLIALALSNEGLGHKHEAIKAAEEVIKLGPNNSANDLQAKAIIAGVGDDKTEVRRALKLLMTRARNNGHYTVADNIAIELAASAQNAEETLQHLAFVRSRREREYNYVRATIRRVETLLNAGRSAEISELDRQDLWRSYALAYTQRLGGLFDTCHRVTWEYLGSMRDYRGQRELFVHSSFLWRLRGDVHQERKYAQLLVADASSTVQTGRIAALIRYCRSRLNVLSQSDA